MFLMLFLLSASLLAVAAWLYLLTGHGWYWRTDQRLPADAGQAGPPGAAAWPPVVAVVPARDEAQVLPETLPTLLAQSYPGELTVVLVDDESTDGTAQVAAELSEQARRGDPGSGARMEIVPGAPTPPGWA